MLVTLYFGVLVLPLVCSVNSCLSSVAKFALNNQSSATKAFRWSGTDVMMCAAGCSQKLFFYINDDGACNWANLPPPHTPRFSIFSQSSWPKRLKRCGVTSATTISEDVATHSGNAAVGAVDAVDATNVKKALPVKPVPTTSPLKVVTTTRPDVPTLPGLITMHKNIIVKQASKWKNRLNNRKKQSGTPGRKYRSQATCPHGYSLTKYRDKKNLYKRKQLPYLCLRLHNGRALKWQSAKASCKRNAGRLAVGNINVRMKMIQQHLKTKDLISAIQSSLGKKRVWIGLRGNEWIDGSAKTYTKFTSKRKEDGGPNDCVSVQMKGKIFWEYENCNKLNFFVCEFAPTKVA